MATSGLVNHDKFYLVDGDLAICSAPSPDGVTTVFRVHKAVMAYNSPVFRDMFALPTAPEGQEMHEGVPVVKVTDAAEDIHALLDALYNPGALSVPRWHPGAPIMLTPAMRLATKYQVDSVRAHIIAILEESWPRTFEQWLRFDTELAALRKQFVQDKPKADLISFYDGVPEPAAAVRFARDFDVPSILPFALYVLATIPAKSDWDRYHTEPPDQSWFRPRPRSARWGLLRADEVLLVLHGSRTFNDYRLNLENDFFARHHDQPGCTTRGSRYYVRTDCGEQNHHMD